MALTALPAETAEAFAKMSVPCRHFQFMRRIHRVPIGFCWRRGTEVTFSANRCNSRCRMFACGLFDPKKHKCHKTPYSGHPVAIYRSEVERIQSGKQKNYFNWRAWMIFSQVARFWAKSQGKDHAPKKKFPVSDQILCLPADQIKWKRYGLPTPRANQSVFEHLCNILPKERVALSTSRRAKAIATLEAFISRSEYRGRSCGRTIIVRYYNHRETENIPGD